ncbi:hypothetical protein BGZ83_006484 [Gryganskiella cystojenkinii]|nr:hypothetical protein BGZ83_006484 [Gryganskiella cystojenkinii]
MASRVHPLAALRRQQRQSQDYSQGQDRLTEPSGPAPVYQATAPVTTRTHQTSRKSIPRNTTVMTTAITTIIKNNELPSYAPPEYTPPTTRPVSPLDIPELVKVVGQRIPLWIPDPYLGVHKFFPKTLIRCSSVCKLWHEVMTPLVWYFFDDGQRSINLVPIDVLRRNAHWIRVLERHHNFRALTSILLDDDEYSMPYSSLPKERRHQSLSVSKAATSSWRQLSSSAAPTPISASFLAQSPPKEFSKWRLPWRRSHDGAPSKTAVILAKQQQQQRPTQVYPDEKKNGPIRTIPEETGITPAPTPIGMVLLTQLAVSAWVHGTEKMIRMNPRLERLAWHGEKMHENIPPEIWHVLQGTKPTTSSPSSSSLTSIPSATSTSSSSSTFSSLSSLSNIPTTLPASISPFQRLRDLELKRCNLDASLFFPVLEKLPSMRIMSLIDVVILNINLVRPPLPHSSRTQPTSQSNGNGHSQSSSIMTIQQQQQQSAKTSAASSAMGVVPMYRFPQIREIRFGPGLQKSQGLEGLVQFCPHLMRLRLESDHEAWSKGGLIFNPSNLLAPTNTLSAPALAAIPPQKDVILALVQHLKESCPRLRGFEYIAPDTRPNGTSLFSEEQCSSFAQCLAIGAAKTLPEQFTVHRGGSQLDYGSRMMNQRPMQHIHPQSGSYLPQENQQNHDRDQFEKAQDREADEQDKKDLAIATACSSSSSSSSDRAADHLSLDDMPSYLRVEFKADMYRLDFPTTSAICQTSLTLQSISLFLYHGSVDDSNPRDDSIRTGLRNVLLILTTCQALRSFRLEYAYANNTGQAVATATYHEGRFKNQQQTTPAAWTLFDQCWNCIGLERLVLSGIKRAIHLDRDGVNPNVLSLVQRSSTRNVYYVPVKMRDLLTIGQLTDWELGNEGGLGVVNHLDHDEDGNVKPLQGGPTRGLRQFQQMMFSQLARLSELKELTFNNSSFRDFSKVQQIVRNTPS